ncbi:MAG: transposase [Gammaproteobacteria bacterium]|nr:transposase [Gammaproteobacteria bacterium]
MQFKTVLEADVPRVCCREHGVLQVKVPWAEPGSGFTTLFEAVAMDMWPAFIKATRAHVHDAEEKIAFDKFHVAKYLGDGVDRVRREEHRRLMQQADTVLKGSKYAWLTKPHNMSRKQKARFAALRDSNPKTARAWAMKEMAMGIWAYRSRGWAVKAWAKWFSWAQRCRLVPMRKVAKTLKAHCRGILNAMMLDVHNGYAESTNAHIRRIKARTCGFRSRERFRNAVYFHCGGLSLMPEGIDQAWLPT